MDDHEQLPPKNISKLSEVQLVNRVSELTPSSARVEQDADLTAQPKILNKINRLLAAAPTELNVSESNHFCSELKTKQKENSR